MTDSPRDGNEDHFYDQPELGDGFQNGDDFQFTEQMIQAAGDFIRPRDDHRPRTLETARRECDDSLLERRVGGFFVAAILLLSMASPVADLIREYPSRSPDNLPSEIQQKASELSRHSGIGPQWATFEVFSQLRQSQASRLQPPQ